MTHLLILRHPEFGYRLFPEISWHYDGLFNPEMAVHVVMDDYGTLVRAEQCLDTYQEFRLARIVEAVWK